MVLLSKSKTAPDLITHHKVWFVRHEIPGNVVSNNGLQFQASESVKFSDDYGVKHEPRSPKYPQRNSEIGKAVTTVKLLFQKSTDPYLAPPGIPLENG